MFNAIGLSLANNFDACNCGWFFDGEFVYCTAELRATDVINMHRQITVMWSDIAFNYPQCICSPMNMIHSIYIADSAHPEGDIELYYILHCEPPCMWVAAIPLFEIQAHLLLALNTVFDQVICQLHGYPATIFHFAHCTFIFDLVPSLSSNIILWYPIGYSCFGG